MFEDRTKNSYNFEKMDQTARTQVITKLPEQKSEAHKRLFGAKQPLEQEVLKQEVKQEILSKNNQEIAQPQLPSTSYLKTFENQVVPDEQEAQENAAISEAETQLLIDSAINTKVDTKLINSELKNVAAKPKKNYSFRIKLVAGVYCILVALFGGWVISNAVNISNLSSNIQQTTQTTAEINTNIAEIISKIKGLDSATGDPDSDSGIVEIITEEIDITPEEVNKPNEYAEESNWFDAVCNWISGLFGR